jgi:hypothetical protein
MDKVIEGIKFYTKSETAGLSPAKLQSEIV